MDHSFNHDHERTMGYQKSEQEHNHHGDIHNKSKVGNGADHSGHKTMIRERIWNSALLSIPVVLY